MKNIILALLLSCLSIISHAQNINGDLRYVEVIGSAEKELIADQFDLSITIKEYYQDNDRKEKISIAVIEQQLSNILKKLGLSSKDISVANIGEFRDYENKNKEYFISKKFNIQLSKIELLNKLLKEIDSKSIANMYIHHLSNKDILQHQKDIRIEALKAAQEKAKYLLASMGEELGELISITETNVADLRMSNAAMGLESSSNEGLGNLRKMTINYSIKVKFAIK